MEEETKVESETSVESTTDNQTEETVVEKAEQSPKISDEELAELKKRADLADNYKIRAEKAEKKLKDTSKKIEEKADELSLTPKDTLSIIEAKVHSEDVEHVAKWAKFNNQTIAEALKDDTLKTVLREREEKRKSEETANVKVSRPSSKITGDTIYEQTKQGHGPSETDDDAMDKLAEAILKRKYPNYGKK